MRQNEGMKNDSCSMKSMEVLHILDKEAGRKYCRSDFVNMVKGENMFQTGAHIRNMFDDREKIKELRLAERERIWSFVCNRCGASDKGFGYGKNWFNMKPCRIAWLGAISKILLERIGVLYC